MMTMMMFMLQLFGRRGRLWLMHRRIMVRLWLISWMLYLLMVYGIRLRLLRSVIRGR